MNLNEEVEILRGVPIFSKIAGDGIGLPRCWVRNETTCPPICRFGT